MRKTALLVAVISTVLTCALCSARAQEKDAPKQAPNIQPVQPYRLDFSFNEVADGKIANTRHYSMDLTAGESNEIKIGTRVPVATGAGTPSAPMAVQYQYLDVGTNLWAQLREHGDELMLVVRSEVSNLDTSNSGEGSHGAGPAAERRQDLGPVIRQIKISGSTLLATGKPILIGSMDDPNSKRQFQLEVTVTKLK